MNRSLHGGLGLLLCVACGARSGLSDLEAGAQGQGGQGLGPRAGGGGSGEGGPTLAASASGRSLLVAFVESDQPTPSIVVWRADCVDVLE